MKFGEKLHLHRVPAWEQHYLPYTHLKSLLKTATWHAFQSKAELDLREFYACFDRGIDALHTFLHDRFAFLRCKELNFYEPYNLSLFGSTLPSLDLMDRFELEDVCAVAAELRADYIELQCFNRSNQEATLRIYTKLRKVDHAFTHQHLEEMTRRLEEQLSCERQCLKQIETLQTLFGNISRTSLSSQAAIHTMDLSLRLRIFDDQVPEISSYLTAIDGYIRTDQAYDLVDALKKIYFLLGAFPTQFQTVFDRLLALSISCRSWSCAKSLVEEELALNYLFVNHNCLNHLIGVTGRGFQRNDYFIHKNIRPEIVDPNFKEAGTSLFLQMVQRLGPRSKDVLQSKDAIGRLSLHYGAIYGLTTICQIILEPLHDQSRDTFSNGSAILAADNEGLTPLHWSVIRGHIGITKLFLTALDTCLQTSDEGQIQHLGAILSALLLIALKYQDDNMVRLLASSHININHQSSSGETALYVAAGMGREDYVDMLLKIVSHQNADIDIRETAYGWTPLFIASVHGHLSVVELLLRAGADKTVVDYQGWTATENAAFRGHLPTAEMIQMSTTVEAVSGSAPVSCNTTSAPKYHLQPFCTYIVVNLGVMQKERQMNPTDFKCFVPELNATHPDTTLSLEISTPAGNNATHLLRLPVLSDSIDDTFVFPAENASETRLIFKLFLANSTQGQKGTLVGSGTALLLDDRNCFGAQRESLIRERSVPILEKETLDFLGTVTFTFVLAKPFPHLNNPTPSINYLEKQDSVQLVGHRGLGQNVGDCEYLQLGENTVESFLSAAKLGASIVEFDVQMTRDLVPVLYHDFSLSESGTDVPIHDLTFNQFIYASKIQSPRGEPVSVLGRVEPKTALPGPERQKPRSRSLTRDGENGAKEIQDRMKYTVDFINKGFKPNTRGDFIQDSFATLEEALREIPESIAFDMEIKYPRIHEALGAGVAPVTIDLNVFIDTILSIVSRFAGTRNIILSSFTPEVCILLALKQKAYPVLFITNAGKRPMTDKELRAGSLQVAVRFAMRWGLAGIVFASEVFLMCPRLVGYVKRKGLVCGSYGRQNNAPETVELQVKAGIDLIVADRVGLISKILNDLSLQCHS